MYYSGNVDYTVTAFAAALTWDDSTITTPDYVIRLRINRPGWTGG
jgi:hypothetical protein